MNDNTKAMSPRERGYDAVDATVFSSDMLYSPEERSIFARYLARWNTAFGETQEPEAAPRSCENGCNGCDECTDYDEQAAPQGVASALKALTTACKAAELGRSDRYEAFELAKQAILAIAGQVAPSPEPVAQQGSLAAFKATLDKLSPDDIKGLATSLYIQRSSIESLQATLSEAGKLAKLELENAELRKVAASAGDALTADISCYSLPVSDKRFADEIQIQRVRQIEGPEQWAVRLNGDCLNKQGVWEWEPQPSGRDSAFIERCRYTSAADGIAAARAALTQSASTAEGGV